MKPIAKIFVLILTTGILGVSVWGNIELRQEFDPMWFCQKNLTCPNGTTIMKSK